MAEEETDGGIHVESTIVSAIKKNSPRDEWKVFGQVCNSYLLII